MTKQRKTRIKEFATILLLFAAMYVALLVTQ